jgi:hypothetical protein
MINIYDEYIVKKMLLLFKSKNIITSSFPNAKHPLFFMGVSVVTYFQNIT